MSARDQLALDQHHLDEHQTEHQGEHGAFDIPAPREPETARRSGRAGGVEAQRAAVEPERDRWRVSGLFVQPREHNDPPETHREIHDQAERETEREIDEEARER